MKIYTPVKNANGVWASVRFVNGVGETDNPTLIKWFESHGYTVENTQDNTQELRENLVIEPQNDQIAVKNDEVDEDEMMGYSEKTPDFEAMTPLQLREWARANGLGGVIKNTRNKEKLLELIKQNRG
jgi:hypothetical protein